MRLSTRQYADILDKAFAKAETEHDKESVIRDFAKMVIDDGRTSRLGEILSRWSSLYNKRHGLLDVAIETADKSTVSFPHSFAGKKVTLDVTENPLLIGGSIFKIGDYIIDSSIRTKINALRQ